MCLPEFRSVRHAHEEKLVALRRAHSARYPDCVPTLRRVGALCAPMKWGMKCTLLPSRLPASLNLCSHSVRRRERLSPPLP